MEFKVPEITGKTVPVADALEVADAAVPDAPPNVEPVEVLDVDTTTKTKVRV